MDDITRRALEALINQLDDKIEALDQHIEDQAHGRLFLLNLLIETNRAFLISEVNKSDLSPKQKEDILLYIGDC